MNEKPGYYAIIPADVRYDKQLPQGAKLSVWRDHGTHQ
jgi:hypothetical protein